MSKFHISTMRALLCFCIFAICLQNGVSARNLIEDRKEFSTLIDLQGDGHDESKLTKRSPQFQVRNFNNKFLSNVSVLMSSV